MSVQIPVEKMIEIFGQNVTIKKRAISSDSDGIVTSDTFSSTISTKAWIVSVRGLRETWDTPIGYNVDADYSCIFKASETLSINDVVILPNTIETQIIEIIPHYYKDNVEFYEAMLRRIGGEESV